MTDQHLVVGQLVAVPRLGPGPTVVGVVRGYVAERGAGAQWPPACAGWPVVEVDGRILAFLPGTLRPIAPGGVRPGEAWVVR